MSNTLTFLKQQNDDLFKENRELRNRLLEMEVRLGDKISCDRGSCNNCACK